MLDAAFAPPPGVEAHSAADRAAWLKLRRRDLTASDVGAVMGLSSLASPLTVWEAKRAARPEEDGPILQRGRWLEPAVLEALAEERPDLRDIRRPGLYLRRPDWRLGATPDALASDAAGQLVAVQTKVLTPESAAEEWGEGAAPARYEVQTLAEAMLSGAEYGLLVALVIEYAAARLLVREIPRHAGAECAIVAAAQEFARLLDSGEAPAARKGVDSRALDRLTTGDAPPADWDGDREAAALIRRRLRLKAEAKAAEEEAAEVDAALKERMGNSAAATCGPYRISWREVSRRSVTTPAYSYRDFRISERK